jgi:NAD(P)-dependent dehydrogenase (short-subunit alcohol dehydrogenase family)
MNAIATKGLTLKDRTILVTGAASGIGQAAAQHFARLGASVLLSDVNLDAGRQVASAIGPTAHFVELDVTSEKEWQRAFETGISLMGSVNGLFNCAGLVDVLDDIDNIELDQWRRILQVNLEGSFLGCKYGVRFMRESGGSIVNVGSIYGAVGGTGSLAYAASKGGILMLTQSVASYCLAKGYPIRCNDILPGYIDTAGLGNSLDALGGRARIADMHPLRRLGTPAEAASLVAFLLSDDASFITGSHYPIDGGYLAQ